MIGTSYFTVYKRAVSEFKDPTLKKMLVEQPILFCESMYNFLENSISQFINPKEAYKRVNNRDVPYTTQNQFVGDGTQSQFELSEYPPDELDENCLMECYINGVPIYDYVYDIVTHTIILDKPLQDGETLECIIYYIGNWRDILFNDEIYILSQFIMSCWSEYVSNDKLDIMRLLGDTDFKLTSNATTTTAKTSWCIVNRETVCKKMNKYAWNCKMSGVYK